MNLYVQGRIARREVMKNNIIERGREIKKEGEGGEWKRRRERVRKKQGQRDSGVGDREERARPRNGVRDKSQ